MFVCAGHYKALEWVEDAKDWRINNDMGIQVTVEVNIWTKVTVIAANRRYFCFPRAGSQDGKCGG